MGDDEGGGLDSIVSLWAALVSYMEMCRYEAMGIPSLMSCCCPLSLAAFG